MSEEVGIIETKSGVVVVKIHQISWEDFGALSAMVHNYIGDREEEGKNVTLEDICNIEGITPELVKVILKKLAEDGEIYTDYAGHIKIL